MSRIEVQGVKCVLLDIGMCMLCMLCCDCLEARVCHWRPSHASPNWNHCLSVVAAFHPHQIIDSLSCLRFHFSRWRTGSLRLSVFCRGYDLSDLVCERDAGRLSSIPKVYRPIPSKHQDTTPTAPTPVLLLPRARLDKYHLLHNPQNQTKPSPIL